MWRQPNSRSCLKLSTNKSISRFLLVSLNTDAILQETTIYHRRQKLNAMTDGLGLGNAYGATLGRIKGQGWRKAKLGMAALMWISHAERPLKPDELRYALAVEIGSSNLNSDNIPSIGTLLACCQGLVVVDKEASTIRLIHFTLQEYLLAHPGLFGTAHSTIAETCLSYLNSQQVKALPTSPSPDHQSSPLLEYSSLYWGIHAERELSDGAKLLALKLFDYYSNHISIKIFLEAKGSYYHNFLSLEPYIFSGLHCASAFGIDEIVASFVEVGSCDINQEDSLGNTPLLWAAWNGHEGVVKILLGWDDVIPDKSDGCGRAPLHCAAMKGHQGVVKILLQRGDVNPNEPDWFGQTPLCHAAENGHEGVVKILLGRDGVIPDKSNACGRTPLHCAAMKGHQGVVKMLLERGDGSPDEPDRTGQTPLSCAAEGGHEGVAKILLGRDGVNPDEPDKFGQTPLCYAAVNGHEGVVKVLLGRDDVHPDQPDGIGRTPLAWATINGHEKIITILQPHPPSTTRPKPERHTPLPPSNTVPITYAILPRAATPP